MRVLIAGGGTGGLAAAIALRKAGIEPLVLEQAPAFTAIGAGLGLYANAMKALSYLEADSYWRQTAARIDVSEQRGLGDDELITASSLEPRAAKYGEPYYCGHRADLLTSLLMALPAECVRTGSRVVAVEETARDVRVELGSGEEVRGDLLVGADGLRSATRKLLMGEREARFTDVVVWRGLIPRQQVPPRYDAKIMAWFGPRRHVLLYPLRHDGHPDSVYSLSAFVLAACLRRAGAGNERAALREYAFRRQPRTTRMLESSRVNLRNSQTSDPVQVRARNGYYRGLERLSPAGPPMQEWLLAHNPVAAARQSPAEFEQHRAVPGNPMRRPESRRAFDLWRTALTGEHRAAGWLGERRGYAEFVRGKLRPVDSIPAPAASVSCDGTPALRAGRPRDNAPVVLHLHGGGYVMGSAELSAPLAGRLAAAAGGWSLVPDYRLAPEHPFPAALRDVLAAYRWLARQYPRAPILVSGECAGGGLALSLVLALRDAAADGDGPATRMPAGLHVVSPFCDLALSAEQLSTAAGTDPWFNRITLTQLAACYIHDADPGQPLVSSSRADLSGLPPLRIQAAEPETLFPGARRLAVRPAARASRSRSARSPTAFIPSSCSTSCQKQTAHWRSSPRSRARCSRPR